MVVVFAVAVVAVVDAVAVFVVVAVFVCLVTGIHLRHTSAARSRLPPKPHIFMLFAFFFRLGFMFRRFTVSSGRKTT